MAQRLTLPSLRRLTLPALRRLRFSVGPTPTPPPTPTPSPTPPPPPTPTPTPTPSDFCLATWEIQYDCVTATWGSSYRLSELTICAERLDCLDTTWTLHHQTEQLRFYRKDVCYRVGCVPPPPVISRCRLLWAVDYHLDTDVWDSPHRVSEDGCVAACLDVGWWFYEMVGDVCTYRRYICYEDCLPPLPTPTPLPPTPTPSPSPTPTPTPTPTPVLPTPTPTPTPVLPTPTPTSTPTPVPSSTPTPAAGYWSLMVGVGPSPCDSPMAVLPYCYGPALTPPALCETIPGGCVWAICGGPYATLELCTAGGGCGYGGSCSG